MLIRHPTIIQDALYNAHPDANPRTAESVSYANGVVVGVMAALRGMSKDIMEDFPAFVKRHAHYFPDKVMAEAVPQAWQDDFRKAGINLVAE